MDCRINTLHPPSLYKFSARKPSFTSKIIAFSSSTPPNQVVSISTTTSTFPKTDNYTVNFKTLEACKLGISRYPDFEYNAEGGTGTGFATKIKKTDLNDEISVSFDLKTLYIPPLTSGTTKFLGLPMPPGLKIDIVPELFQGTINRDSGKVDLEFMAKFWFSVGSIYKAPSLLVKTVLTSEESNGVIRSARGERLDREGKCRLVGVATVEPIDDFFMNTFLGLPTECLANLNAFISFPESY
ncbi:uncharacterized protein LOC8258306 [Ricinus communis]|uniref:Uncharacterized protein n=1 Tax=Ricinus communis TaxID=3988 RepID=B9R9H5_RICCO|nr:uncharacterized protein LOC8258306 [Ricinus communis]EEF51452.1 conserved hypothetical protein [Ricinus communis]|eukprot:XP_002510850.1 uncharacterized protein LOC8258306 [Ricinus communis]